jgi:DNA ligase-1
MAKREFLQLANKYRPGKDKIAGWYLSEKLDGTRCFWDGGISRDVPTELVPWASIIDPKTGKKKAKIKPVATGLWTRYGNPIIAPDSFLNLLPCIPLDGELWAGRGKFQLCLSICAGDTPDPRFDCIEFAVYGTPPLSRVFGDGAIKNANMAADLRFEHIDAWIENRVEGTGFDLFDLGPTATFDVEMLSLRESLDVTERVYMLQQIKLPISEEDARAMVEEELDRVLDRGGEGVMLRNPDTPWTPKRHAGLLKYKPFEDDEGTVVGFTSGRETDRGSKFLGKIGALVVNYQGKRLELSGMKDYEREFATTDMAAWATENPGKEMPKGFQGKHFKVGQRVTFKYRELTDDGIPKEARYWRRRDDE